MFPHFWLIRIVFKLVINLASRIITAYNLFSLIIVARDDMIPTKLVFILCDQVLGVIPSTLFPPSNPPMAVILTLALPLLALCHGDRVDPTNLRFPASTLEMEGFVSPLEVSIAVVVKVSDFFVKSRTRCTDSSLRSRRASM